MIQRALMHRLTATTPPLGAVPAVAFALGMLVGTAAAQSLELAPGTLPWSSAAAAPIAPELERPGMAPEDPPTQLANAQIGSAVSNP